MINLAALCIFFILKIHIESSFGANFWGRISNMGKEQRDERQEYPSL